MIFNREPVLFMALVQAVLALVVSFGVGLTGGQVGTITAVSAALLSLVARKKVTPV